MQAAVIHADGFRLVVQQLAVAHFLAGPGNVRELGDRRPPGLGGDGRQEVLFRAVAELDPPGDRAFLFVAVDANAVAQRGKVGIAAHVDRMLRASLHAGVALPAHVGLDVVGTPIGLIDVHDVRGTDVDAVSASVAPCHVDEGRHVVTAACSSSGGALRA